MSEVDRLTAEVKRKEMELIELQKKQLEIKLEKMKQSIREEEEKVTTGNKPSNSFSKFHLRPRQ